MNVIKASAMGSCFGVERALKLFFEQADTSSASPLYTYGQLIHNKVMLRRIEEKCDGVIKDASAKRPGRVVICAHGIDSVSLNDLVLHGFEIIDATCPFVKKNILSIQAETSPVLYIGQAAHSETASYKGSASVPFHVLEKAEDVSGLPKEEHYSLYMQTTVDGAIADAVLKALDENHVVYEVRSGICQASRLRREAIDSLASKVKVIIVVGDRTSANSMALLKRAEERGALAYLVETADEVAQLPIKGEKEVGLSAAASVTGDLIEKVYQCLLDL